MGFAVMASWKKVLPDFILMCYTLYIFGVSFVELWNTILAQTLRYSVDPFVAYAFKLSSNTLLSPESDKHGNYWKGIRFDRPSDLPIGLNITLHRKATRDR